MHIIFEFSINMTTKQIPLQMLVCAASDLAAVPFFIFPDQSRKEYLIGLKKLADDLEPRLKKTQGNIYRMVEKLRSGLFEDGMDELEVSLFLIQVAEFYNEDDSPEEKKLAAELNGFSSKFYGRAKTFQVFHEKREQIKKTKNESEILAIDRKNLEVGGVFYTFDYYLEIFLSMKEKDDEGKKGYLVYEKIDIGTGQSTGLLEDLSNDDALTKFILLLVNDDWRDTLIRSYYGLKQSINKIKVTVKNGVNVYDHGLADIGEIMRSFKKLNLNIVDVLRRAGLSRVKFMFYHRLGEEPSLDEVEQAING